jgi:hypothetical protein
MILLLYQSASTAQLCFWLHAAGDAMRDAARVMEAALERFARGRIAVGAADAATVRTVIGGLRQMLWLRFARYQPATPRRGASPAENT